MKKQDKTSEKEINKMEISNLLDRVQNNDHKDAYQTRRMDELSENFKKDRKNIKKNQSDLKNTITKVQKKMP